MKRYEYVIKNLEYPINGYELNEMGNKGWELVCYMCVHTRAYEYIFKREKSK